MDAKPDTATEKDTLADVERVKYEKMWAIQAYRDNEGNRKAAERFLRLVKMPKGSSVLDVGCGPGYASRHFVERGMKVVAADIAANAMPEENRSVVEEFVVGSAWDLPRRIQVDYGFCTDMMEHIPTRHVMDTLAAIKACVRNEVYFDIGLRKDSMGKLINDTLHLTVRPLDWWCVVLARHWRHIAIEGIKARKRAATLLVSDRPIVGVPMAIRS
jgi:SAM-dependent methyltransferase